MVSIKTLLALGLIVGFFAFGGLQILSRAKDKATELKSSIDTKIKTDNSRRVLVD